MRPRAGGWTLERVQVALLKALCGGWRKQGWGFGPGTQRSSALTTHTVDGADHSQGQGPRKGNKTSPRNPGKCSLERRGAEVCSGHRGGKACLVFGPRLLEIRAPPFTRPSAPGRVCTAAVGALAVLLSSLPFHAASDGLTL